MDRNLFPRRIRLVLLLLVFACCHLFSAGDTVAQGRAESAAGKETPSQRYLPLPQIESANPRQQLEWLKQLKAGLSANSELSELPALQGLSADDLKVLQEAIKQGGAEAALRSVEKSGSLPNGLTPEQVSKAMADPAVREKVKRALEQFANGVQQTGRSTSNGPNGIPFPTNRPSPNRADAASPQNKPGTDSTTNGAAESHQRIAQSILEGLAKPSIRQSKSTDRKQVSEDPEPSTKEPSLQQPNLPQQDSVPASNLPNPRESSGKEIDSGDRNLMPSEKALPASSGSSSVPNENAVPSIANTPRPTDPKEGLTGRPSGASESSTSGNARRTGPVILPNRDRRPNANRTANSTNPNSPSAQGGLRAVGGRDDSMDSRKAMSGVDAIRRPQSSKPSSPNAAASTPASSLIPPTAPSDQNPSSVDVRHTLEERGFAATLRQLVDEARRGAENDIAAQRRSDGSGNVPSSLGATLDGLYEAVKRFPNGAGHDKSPEAPSPDSNQPQKNPMAGPTVVPSPAPASEQPTSPTKSALSRVSEAADNALSRITRPEPVEQTPGAVNGTIATPPDEPEDRSSGTVSVMWLGMVLALVSVGWFAATRLLNAVLVSPQAGMLAAAPIDPAEVWTRRDIVSAFHQFALRPKMPVADWWTHRQVAQQVATSTPSLAPAIHQLAEIYEQARYLPEETVFTADQVGTARRALKQCQTNLASDM